MMKKRLLLAKRLLKPDGVLVIAIDDNEARHLTTLLDELLPEFDATVITVVHNPRGNITNNFARTHEYAVFLIPKNKSLVVRTIKENVAPRKLRRWGHNSTRTARPTMFYPIYVKDGRPTRVGDPPAASFHPAAKNVPLNTGEVEVWPIDQNGIERRWNFGLDAIEEEFDRIVALKDEKGLVDLFLSEEETVPKTVWAEKRFEAGKYGASLVKEIVQRPFPFPKSVYTVQQCLDLVLRNRDKAVILDFFAGSGTTLHATLLLNVEQPGNRQCILVTNNEVEEKQSKALQKRGIYPGDRAYEAEGICESITWPRCKYVVQGHRDDGSRLLGKYLSGRELKEGFKGNIEYFRVDFVDPALVERGDAFEGILPILWMIAGAIGNRESRRGSTPWYIASHSPFAVLIREAKFSEFREALRDRVDVRCVFLITDSDDNFAAMRRALGRHYRCIQLYKSYLENFRINTIDRRAAGENEELE
jgi:adenine-specific DNA-methyltransferase